MIMASNENGNKPPRLTIIQFVEKYVGLYSGNTLI